MTAAPTRVGPGGRRQSSFGGLVPSAAVDLNDQTLVAALAVELHAEGAVIPLIVLSNAPGVVGWDLARGLVVGDDAGRSYSAEVVSQSAGLGALQAAAWIEPAPPPEARCLTLEVSGLVRASAARGGPGIERPIHDERAFDLAVPLVPDRTAAPAPEPPDVAAPVAEAARAPARARSAFESVVPIGQARMAEEATVCLWALERYRGRSVLTLAALSDGDRVLEPLGPGTGIVEAWDDRGRRYAAQPVHGSARNGWMESSVELTPELDRNARAIGVRVSDLPARDVAGRMTTLAGPFEFGLAVAPG